MDERLRKLRLERGQALLESCRMRDFDRSPEETARLKQRGRLLYEERLRAEEKGSPCVEMRYHSEAVIDLCSIPVKEGQAATEKTHGLSYVLPQPVELLSESRRDGDNISTSHDCTTAIIDYSILDSVREQHIRDVRQIEILTKESHLLQETIEKQQEALTKLAAELAQRDAQIQCNLKNDARKLIPPDEKEMGVRYDGGSDHMQEMDPAMRPRAQDNCRSPHLKTFEDLHDAESLVARKQVEIQELQLKLQEKILYCDKLGEENKNLNKNNQKLQEEVAALLKKVCMIQEELINTTEQENYSQKTVIYLEHKIQMKSEYKPYTPVPESTHMEEELERLARQCADAEATMHRMEAEMAAENAKLKEELCRMQQSHEEERQAAGAAMHRMEAGMRSQQQTQLAGPPRRAAASSTNPFASMGAPSKEPGSFPDQGDDGDDVFGVGTEQHRTATGDAVSGDGQAEPEGLVTELRGRLAELEAALSSATLARDSAVGEVERLARQCADAEATMHRMEAEMAAENAKLKEELCRMQQSHEEERQAAGAAMHRMEAGMRSQQQTQLAGPPRRAAASSTNPFASMGAPSKEPGSFPDQGDDGDDVFGVGTEQHRTATGDAVSGDGQAEPEGLVTELRGRLAELEAALSSATLARDSAVGEVERLARQCADAETTMHRMEAEMAAENAKLKEELCRMQQSHEEERQAAGAAMHRMEAGMRSQQQTQLAGPPRRAAASSTNPFASMGAPSKEPGSFPDQGDDGDDVFGVGTEQHRTATGDAVSGDGQAEPEGLVTELRGRLAELEAALSSATLARDSAVGEVERLARQCADAEATMHRMEAEMAAENAKLKEELCRMQQSHEEEIEAALLEASDRIAEHDDLLRHKLEEQEAELEARFLEQLNSFKEPGGDSDALHSLLSLKEENAKLKEELCRMQQSHEEERQAAGAAMHRMEAGMRSQQQTQLAGPPRRAAASSTNPFASMGAPSKEPGSFPDQGDDGDDVFGVGTEQHRTATGDAVSGDGQAEPEGLVTELRGRLAELEAALSSATLARDSAVGEVERLARQCADAETTMHRMEAEMAAENAKLKEELCRMQQSHEEERQAAGAAMHRMEAGMRSQQQTQLAGPPRRAAASSTNPFASMGAPSKEPGSFPDQGDDGDDVFGVGTEQHRTATGDAVSGDGQAEPEGLVTELRGRLAELEAALSSATLARDSAVGEVERLARQCADAEATMHRMEAEMAAENAKLKEELCRMQQSHEEEIEAALLEASDRIAEHDDLLRHKLEEQEAELEARFLEQLNSFKEPGGDSDALHSLLSLKEENAKLKEELCRMQQSHEEERQAAGAAMHRMEAGMRSQQQTQLAGPPRRAAASSTNPFASMGAPSKEPGSFPDQGDDGDDVFGVGTEQHRTATGDAVSGDGQAEPEGLVTEPRGRLAELEAALSSATLARDSAVGEVERLARQCADAEATMHRMEAEMAAENAKLKEELCRMQQSHEEEIEAALLEASDRIAEHDDLLRHKLEEQEAELEARFLEQLNSFKEPGGDSDALHSLLSLKEENAKLKEELCRMQQSHEEERQAAGAAMHRMEAGMRSQQQTQLAGPPRRAAASSTNPFASMGAPSKEPGSFPDQGDDGDDVFGVGTEQHRTATGDAVSGDGQAEPEGLVTELRGRLAELEAALSSATLARDSAVGEVERLARQCADAEATMHRMEAEMAAENAKLKEELCRMQQSHEEERQAAGAAMHRMEAGMRSQQQTQLAGPPRRAAASSTNPFASMGAPSKEPGSFPDQGDDGDDVFGVGTEQHRTATGDAVSGDGQAEPEGLVTEPRGRLAELEAALSSATLARDSAVGEVERLARQCADAEATMHRMEAEMAAENAKLKEELCRMQQSHEEEIEAALLEASDRIAEHDDLLRHKLEEQEAELEARFLEQLNSFKEPGGDSDALHSLLSLKEENAKLKEELCRMQQSHEEERQAAGAAMHRMEAGMRSQQQTQLAGPPRRAAASSTNPFASMGAPSKEPGSFPDQGDDGDDVFGVGTEQHRTATGDAVSGDGQAEPEGLVTELRGRLAELEAALSSATLARDSAVGEVERLARQCADAEATMHRMEAEMAAENAKLKEELCRMQQSHEEEIEAALLEASDRIAEHDDLLRHKLEEQEAELEARFLEQLNSFKEPGGDSDALHSLLSLKEENAKLKEELCRMQQSHEEERQAAGAAMHRMEAGMRSQQQTQLAGPPRRAAASSTNPFASMGAPSKEPGSFPDQGDDGDDVFGVGTEQHRTATGDAVSGDGQAEPEGLVTELRGRLAELEAALSSATLARDSAVGEVERLARQCADAEATMHRMEAEMAAENAKLKEELCRMQQSHEEEIEAALLEASDRIAEHDDLLRHKLEEQEAELEARFLEQLNSFKEPGGDSDALHSLLSLKEENAKLKEELCRMQQSHEEERQAAGAAMHRMEAGMRSQQQTQLAGPPRRAAASSTNPFASMGAPSKEPGSFPDQGDDGDDVFGVGTEQHRTATGDAVSGDGQAEPEGLVTEPRGRLAELEAALSSATLARDSAVGEVERLARQCADAEATMHRMEAEMAAENAKLKEELCRMQQSHEEEIEAALLEASDRIAEHDDLLRHKLEEQEAELEARFLEQLNSFKEPGGDSDALHSLLSLKEENAKLKEELCRMQQSHEEERQAAGAAMHRMEAGMRSQQQTQLAGPPRRAAASSTNPFASMGAPSKEPGSFPDQGDDGDDVFGVGTEQHRTATGDAVSGDGQAEPEGLVTELRGRLAELEAALSSATLARDSAVGEVERLARQCADAEATMHRMEAEMAAENAKLKEELCRMQQSHEEEIEAALLEASDRIAEHDDLLRHKLEEQEAELEARFLEQLNSFKEPGGDSDALHSLLSLKEENAKLKEELCRMQQSHEEERQAAGAAMHRMEAGMRSQQQTQLAGPPRRAAASSTNPFASMGAPSKEPGSFPDQGDDGDDVFGVGTEQHRTATGDAVSGDGQAEPEGLVTELRGRLAELEAALSSATLARDSAVGEVERLARQCADAEATMHRMEAEMAAENAKLKEELCRMQQSHEEEIEAALLEASDRIAEHDDLLRHKLEEQEAELEARFLEQLNSFKEPGGDSDALHSLLSLKEENAKLKEELCRMQQSHEEERQAAGAAMHRMEAGMRSQQQTQLAGPPRRAAASSTNPFASMGAPSKEPGSFPDQGDDGDDVFGVGTEQHRTATGDAVSGDGQAEPEGLVTELRGRLAELEAALSSATLARDSAVGEVERLARKCADAEATMHRMEAEMAAENAKLKEELCRMQQSHEEEIEAALLEASDRIAEHDDLLRHKLEEQEAELEARFLEQLNSFKEPGGDSDALHSLLSLKEENAKLKEELCRMQQSHEEERQAAGAAMHRMEAGMRSQQQTQLAGPPRRAAASSTNPFASMGAPSKEPGSFPDQGDDGDDVFGVGTEQHRTATGDAVSGDGQAEPEGLVTELRGRLAELEAALSSATLARDSAVGEVERLARQCADAEATMHRMEAEMAAENAKLKEELCRMQQSHEEEIEAALLEASDRIAEHDDLLRHKLEEQEAELEARFLEQLNSFKEPGGDSDALHSLLSLKEENAKLKEELCRMQQSHEEERQAAGAAMHRMEAGMRSQQQTQLAGPPRRAAASSTNPFASMGAPSKEPGSFPDQGDDGDDVFGVGTEQHRTATGDAVSGDGQAEPEGLVTELRGRLAELEAALSSATLARDSAVGEVERLARQCADAEATMHRMEAEMAAENAKLKEELCRMQQSHEEEIEAALLEASDRIAEHDDLLRHKLEEQEAELEARFLEQLNSFKEPGGDSDALHSLLSLKEENAKLKEELCGCSRAMRRSVRQRGRRCTGWRPG
ncbi:putative plectin [Trypanosoma cruzi]|uniref:Putative plectin n=3 Tax=Trypanosoma cruzi TaxID=5693 RepID=A0A2V2WGI2_TRYCR|nr:putative plectin [Trypanosoma cruzi]